MSEETGGSDPAKLFGAAESRKSGVAPARFGTLHTAAFEDPVSEVLVSQNLRRVPSVAGPFASVFPRNRGLRDKYRPDP